MQQLQLLQNEDSMLKKGFAFQHIKADFKKVNQTMHEVLLEVNSHKFLIAVKIGLKKLEEFEIIAVRGFIEIGMKVVRLLKRIVAALYFEY